MKKRWIWIAVAVVVIVGAGWIYFKNKNSAAENRPVEKIIRGDLVQTVIATGKTKSAEQVTLAFERIGKVVKIYSAVGKTVTAGQPLIQLDGGEIGAQYAQANAAVANQQALLNQYNAALNIQLAKLAGLQAGTRSEDLAVKESEINKAEQDLKNYLQNISTYLADAVVKADDAAHNKTTGIFSGNYPAYGLSFMVCDEQAKTNALQQHITADDKIKILQTDLNSLATRSDSELENILAADINHLNSVKQFLDTTQALVAPGCLANESTVAGYRTTLNTAQTNVVSSLNTLGGLQQSIASQKLQVLKLKSELTLKQAGSAPQDIDAQKAAVEQARANLAAQKAQVASAQAQTQYYAAQLGKLMLRAPIGGMVTSLDIKIGELAAANTPVVSIIAPAAMEIEVNIPEVDVGKLALANPVKINFDALPGEEFTGSVIYIEPAETIIDGVVQYKVRIGFSQPDDRIKSGLTANLIIETKKVTNALIIPQYAIIDNDQGSFADVSVNGKTERKKIKLGITSGNGQVEVLEGLNDQDLVISSGLKKTQ